MNSIKKNKSQPGKPIMSTSATWSHLRKTIKECPYTNCPRNKNKLPILFGREETSLSKIKFVVVSQEPGISLKKKFDSDAETMEKYLVKDCLKLTSGGTSPINKMIEIFGKNFNPLSDEIYWTHALKCVPKENDREIGKMWKKCASFCANHFKNELSLIPSKKLAIIAIGGYALALCRHVFEGKDLASIDKITKYIISTDTEKKFTFGEKEIFLFPFLHPSHRNVHVTENLENKEKKFIEIIRKIM